MRTFISCTQTKSQPQLYHAKGDGKRGRGLPCLQPLIRQTIHVCAQWTKEAKNGEVFANQVADVHGVPHSTWKDRRKSGVTYGTKPRPHTCLNFREEKELVDNLLNAAKTGFGKMRQQIKYIAENIAKEKGILSSNHISNWWLRGWTTKTCSSSQRYNYA